MVSDIQRKILCLALKKRSITTGEILSSFVGLAVKSMGLEKDSHWRA